MAEFSYRDYETSKELNMPPGSVLDTRFGVPYQGSRVNDNLAALASALRNLGDAVPKLTIDSEGIPELGPNGGRIGTMAWQDADDVAIEGGSLGAHVRGSVPARVVLPWFGTYVEFQGQYPNLRTRGFDICDGRVSTNPANSLQVFTMPNLLDNYLYFYSNVDSVGATGLFAHIKNTEPAGSHNHGGVVVETAITGAQAPTLSKTDLVVNGGGGAAVVKTVAYGGPGLGHGHAIPTETTHVHQVNVRPRTAVFVPIMRVW